LFWATMEASFHRHNWLTHWCWQLNPRDWWGGPEAPTL
jgi:hypothetical protein